MSNKDIKELEDKINELHPILDYNDYSELMDLVHNLSDDKNIQLPKKTVVSLVVHATDNDTQAFKETSYELIKCFDANGDSQLAEHILARIDPSTAWVPMEEE